MNLTHEQMVIESGHREEDGTKLEPEQQPATHVLTGTAPGLGAADGQVHGHIPIQVQAETTAGLVAVMGRDSCMHCKNFDQDAWAAYRHMLMWGTPEQKRELQEIRRVLLITGNADMHTFSDGDVDTEAALDALGVCQVLTESEGEPVIVYVGGCCPEGFPGFCPKVTRNRDGHRVFDAIMRRAAGQE